MIRIACLQMAAVAADPEANLERIGRAAQEAAAGGASLLVAPELAVTGYGAGDAITALAEPLDGEALRRLTALARQTGIAIVAGFAERDADGDVWNSAVFVDGVAPPLVYRKSHLYGDYERRLFRAAAPSAALVDHRGARIGLLICYDVEFPENVRRLALAGCDMVVVPTALPAGSSGSFIAAHMIPVRAFENQVFVAYVNHCGADRNFSYAGLSRIAAPDGSILAHAPAGGEALLFADIDMRAHATSRAENTYLRDLPGGVG